jgi:septal ring factor EnvC (AmiA/AmiB activator)
MGQKFRGRMEDRDRLALAITRVNDALLEQRRQIMKFKQSLSDAERHVKSIERGLHGYAATMARVKREIEHVGREARTLQRIMAAAERGQVPESLDDGTVEMTTTSPARPRLPSRVDARRPLQAASRL